LTRAWAQTGKQALMVLAAAAMFSPEGKDVGILEIQRISFMFNTRASGRAARRHKLRKQQLLPILKPCVCVCVCVCVLLNLHAGGDLDLTEHSPMGTRVPVGTLCIFVCVCLYVCVFLCVCECVCVCKAHVSQVVQVWCLCPSVLSIGTE